MAQFIVRDLEDDVKTRLKRRAAHRGVVALCLGGGNAVALAVER